MRTNSSRIRHIFVVFFLLFGILCVRSVFIQLFPSSALSLKNIANHQYQSTIKLAPYRGSIYDHSGAPLAISIKTPSIAINPKVFQPTPEKLATLGKILRMPVPKLKKLAQRKNHFTWLKRKIPQKAAEKIKALDLKGLDFLLEPARFYPGGSSAAPLLGYVGYDNVGLLGIEREFDKVLRGDSTEVLRLKDAKGHHIFLNANLASPERAGNSIVLTLDRVIQEITEEALASGVKKSRSVRGFAIVSDPHTGRILAIANYPNFDPNDPSSLQVEHTQNSAIAMRFEPGSIMKPFVIAKALDTEKTTPFEIHNCEKSGRLQIDAVKAIHDDHPKEFRSTEEILMHSSNIGVYKIADRMGKQALYDTLMAFGFASSKKILGLPGETVGSIAAWQDWLPIRFANIAFGQGLAVTGLEVVQAYSVFANGGNLVKPYIVERIEGPTGEILVDHGTTNRGRILSSKTALVMRQILEKVVVEGTGDKARIPLFSTAGKTGTAEKIDPETKAYSKTKRIADFAGFAPVADPHIVIFVALDEPQEKPYYGGWWAAPIFGEIAGRALKYLNVAPDKIGFNSRLGFQREKNTSSTKDFLYAEAGMR